MQVIARVSWPGQFLMAPTRLRHEIALDFEHDRQACRGMHVLHSGFFSRRQVAIAGRQRTAHTPNILECRGALSKKGNSRPQHCLKLQPLQTTADQ